MVSQFAGFYVGVATGKVCRVPDGDSSTLRFGGGIDDAFVGGCLVGVWNQGATGRGVFVDSFSNAIGEHIVH